jgi:hypothetical protein
MLAEPKPLLKPRVCGEWLALIHEILFLLSVLVRGFGQENHFCHDRITAKVHNLHRDKTPFGSANFNR